MRIPDTYFGNVTMINIQVIEIYSINGEQNELCKSTGPV
ncbi:MAG: hypothetical protein ACI932_002210, partial [Paracoccaceae bacterium]